MSGIANIARFTARPGKAEELGQRLAALVGSTREEPGCLRYDLLRDEAGQWVVFESWRDEAALQFHLDQPYVAEFIAIMESLIAGDPAVEFYRPVDVSN